MTIFKILRTTSIVFVSIGLVSACSTLSSLNPFAKEDTKNQPAALQTFTPAMAVKQSWTAQVGAAGEYAFNPALVDKSIYAAAEDGTIVKLNAENGQVIWKSKTELSLTAGVAANDKVVAVVGQKGMLYAYDVQGKLRWQKQVSSEVLATPAVSDKLVIVHSIDNRIQAFDLESGENKWIVERPLPILTLRIVTGLTIKDQFVFVTSPGGKLLSIALQNGGLRWEASAAEPKGATELERIVDMSGAPALVGTTVCASTFQGKVACFDADNGSAKWNKPLSSEVGVAVDERFTFAADNEGNVFAYALAGGASVWKNDKFRNRGLTTPTSFGLAAVVGDKLGYVHFLSREDGALMARMPTDGSKIIAAPLIAGNQLITQTKAGALVAFATE
ncbi:MAG: outer membrane protein assembly factor BamB [Burkholderiales bacterium]|nr:outer membrane protein assembly factor BamB [Burkholderiales bacterium]